MAKDRKQETRERIVKAASREFSRGGFDAVTVDAISERAKVAHGTVFLHFGDKSSLYEAAVGQAGDDFLRAMLRQLNREPLTLSCLFRALAAYVRAHPEFAGLLSARRGRSGRVDGTPPELNERLVDFWREAICRLEVAGGIGPVQGRDDAARLIAATVAGLLATGERRRAADALAPLDRFSELAEMAARRSQKTASAPGVDAGRHP